MKNFAFVFSIGVLIGIILFVLDLSFQLISGAEVSFNTNLLISVALYIFYSVPLGLVNSYFFDYLNDKVVWKNREKFRLTVGLVGSVIITLTTLFFIRLIHQTFINGKSLEDFFETERLQFYFIALIITLVISLFFHAFHFYKELQKNKLKEQKIIAGTASAQFESLKNQIDPHFLFNSLNVLTSLIEENPDKAQNFTTSLSKIYRYVLDQKDKELVSLEEELKFAKTYMQLLQMRFENSLFFDLPQNLSNPDAKVVPLSLQLLLENTIKHNIVSESKPLHIRIYEKDNTLVVENDLQRKEVLKTRKGVGLQNIINRYAIVTPRKLKIEETTQHFKVELPVLTKQYTIMDTQSHSNTNEAYIKAHRRVKEIKEFYSNLLSYLIVIPFLIFINYYTYWDFQWFWFPVLGWGIGVSIHGFTVFGYGSSWEEKKIQEIMEKEKQNNKNWN
ncbi:histidine kinase [uncultured Planktosalinus sp.]|uniref:histidine kinase n=1 Tax=uncultured Planktosalinus sp. TaxID=1810935 RepID=UPI0030DAAD12